MTSWTLRTWVLIISTAEASRGFRRLLQLAYWDLAGPALPRGQGWDGMMLSPMVKELYTVQIWELRRWSSNLSNNLWWIKWDCKSVITASHVLSSRYFVQLWRFGNYSPCWEFPKRELGADSSSVQMRLPAPCVKNMTGKYHFSSFHKKSLYNIPTTNSYFERSRETRNSPIPQACRDPLVVRLSPQSYRRLIVSNEVILSLFGSVSR